MFTVHTRGFKTNITNMNNKSMKFINEMLKKKASVIGTRRVYLFECPLVIGTVC